MGTARGCRLSEYASPHFESHPLVLERPEIPLHNNLSENDIRDYVKKRKISATTRSAAGRAARDTFLSLKKTCQKLGLSFWHYLQDRLAVSTLNSKATRKIAKIS